jgi:Polyketide cyclase / dehydrase and lipid transport
MATNRREISLDAPAAKVWAALRDFDQVHTKVAPGFLTRLEMDGADRIVTFFNGMVARERLVTLDDQAMRLVYTIVGGRTAHYNAVAQAVPDTADHNRCRFVWTIDLLPEELGPAVGGMMDHAIPIMKKTLEEVPVLAV